MQKREKMEEDKKPFVSVIVPAYNAEKTIERTINDILLQTYRDFELVLIDDGSTDNTGRICDAIAQDDYRVRVIHQKNAGLSNARNIGVANATGEYVSFVDGDDRIEKRYLEFLVQAITNNDADISCGRIDRVREDYDLSENRTDYQVELFHNRETIQEMLTGRKLTVGACCRLVPRIWQVRHPFLDGAYYEDLSNTYKINMMANQTAFVDAVLYHYVMRGGSITGKKTTSVKQCIDYYEAILSCSEEVLKKYPDLEQDVAVLKARDYMSLYLCIQRCERKDDSLNRIEGELLQWMKHNWLVAARNHRAPVNVRLRALLFGISPRMYQKLYYQGIRIKGKKIA